MIRKSKVPSWCASFLRSTVLVVTTAFAVLARSQDGPYDPTFGNVGRTWIDVTSSTYDRGTKLIRLPNGNFFMAGACGFVTCGIWLTPSGTLASGYGPTGTGTVAFNAFVGWPADGQDGDRDAAAFQDGRVVVTVNYDSYRIAVLRANGTGLDSAVGNGAGYIAPSYQARFVRVTPQQQVIVVGTNGASTQALVVARYDSTMHLDTTFGTNGTTTIGFDGLTTFPQGMTLQKDGKIVVIATVLDSTDQIGIVRLTAGGAPDPAFGINSDGRFKSAFGNSYDIEGRDITVDKQGRLVFAGVAYTSIGGNGEWLVNRLLGGGAVDTNFNGGQPRQFTIFSTSQNYLPGACCIVMQADGRIVAAGEYDRSDAHYKYFAMARFLDNGAFDSTYGISGQSYGDMSPQPDSKGDYPNSMVIVPGGILIGGSTVVSSGETRFSVTKVLIDQLFASDFE